MHKSACSILALFVCLSIGGSASAQRIPTSAEPERVEKRFEAPPSPTVEGQTRKETEVRRARPEPTGPTFLLKEIVLEGAKAIDPAIFIPLYGPLINTQVSLADLELLASQITMVYRNRGYILSRAVVPRQEISAGKVVIRVVEGYVGQADLKGLRDEPVLVRKLVDHITADRPLDSATLERNVLLMNDLPGLRAGTTFSPLSGTPGAARMQVDMEETRVDWLLSADNRGTRYNGPYQFQVGFGANSLLKRFDRTDLRLITTDSTEELQFVSLSYGQPLGERGTRWSLSGFYSQQIPGYLLAPLDTKSRSYRITAEVTHPFIRSRHKNLKGRFMFTMYDIDTKQLGVPVSRENPRSLRAGLTCDWSDQFRGINIADAELSQGLNIFGALDAGSPDLSRPEGRSDYTKLAFYAAREQYLAPNWSLMLKGAGQWAFCSLLASEEFAYGGLPFGRAHDSSEVTGDHGLAGDLELRYTFHTACKCLPRWQPYVYVDAGKVWRKDSSFRPACETASDAGFGIRASSNHLREVSVEFAKPLATGVASRGDDGYGWRVFFNVTAAF